MTEAIPTFINGRWMLNLPKHRADRPHWLIENGGWETERLAAMHDRITDMPDPVIVFDIGAEEGDFSALFTSWGAQVVVFEPNPLVFPNIRFIWEANDLPAPLGYFAGFACNHTNLQPEQVEEIFNQPDRDGWPACAFGPVIGDHGFRNVFERFHDTPQIKLDDYAYLTGFVPDLLTIDVEGSELEVLRGAENILTERHPDVFVSIHPEFITNAYPYSDATLHEFMANLGYTGSHLATDHEEHWWFQ